MKISKPFQLLITAIIILAVPFTVMVSKTAEDPLSNAAQSTPTIVPLASLPVATTITPIISCTAKGGKCIVANTCHLHCNICSSYYGCGQGELCCLSGK